MTAVLGGGSSTPVMLGSLHVSLLADGSYLPSILRGMSLQPNTLNGKLSTDLGVIHPGFA